MTNDGMIDISEVEESALIQHQVDQSIQDFPDATKDSGFSGWGMVELFQRGALLSPRGSMRRLKDLRDWYYFEQDSLFRSAVSGLIKRIQSLPYEIKADEQWGDYWDNVLRYANFNNWDSFLGQLIHSYLLYDTGAFVEIIAPGNPLKAPTGPATGMAILDTRSCILTGDPIYPVIYVSVLGKYHLLHRSRVVQFVDMEEKNDKLPGWGDSAMSRAITPAFRQILMAQYMRTFLDDKPPPGFLVAKNLSDAQIMEAWNKTKERRQNDEDVWGRLVLLWGTQAEITPNLEVISFQKAPEGFDFEKYTALDARMFAAALNIDIQEFWELTGRGIGTGTQSEILEQKSKGKGIGRLIKGIERIINDVFPDDVEFAFKYRNEEEDLQRAQTAQAWGQFVISVSDALTTDEQRIMLANQIEAVKDAITDANGNVIRWNDADPKTEEQANPISALLDDTVSGVSPTEQEAPDENLMTGEQKDYRATRRSFVNFWNGMTQRLSEGRVTPAQAQFRMMSELNFHARETWKDGMKRAGTRGVTEISDAGARTIAQWSVKQRSFVSRYISDVISGKFSSKQLNTKGLQWANKSLEEILYDAMEMTAPRKMWRWLVNFAKENCRSCLRLHNQVHTMAAYRKSGLRPKSSILICKGFECGCRLQATEPGTKARGRLSRVPRG